MWLPHTLVTSPNMHVHLYQQINKINKCPFNYQSTPEDLGLTFYSDSSFDTWSLILPSYSVTYVDPASKDRTPTFAQLWYNCHGQVVLHKKNWAKSNNEIILKKLLTFLYHGVSATLRNSALEPVSITVLHSQPSLLRILSKRVAEGKHSNQALPVNISYSMLLI